jgi:YhcG PDDEXK nuclease domain
MTPDLVLKDPYLLDFLGLNDRYLERDLEDAILREMEQFLLELGAGFTFVARQKRLQIDVDDFYLDLLLYNRKLKRLVAIELKLGAFKAEYKSQMELYLRWLAKHEQEEDEQPPTGIILCAGKKQEQIELFELSKSGIHVAEYLTVLPPREALELKLHQSIALARSRIGVDPDDIDHRLAVASASSRTSTITSGDTGGPASDPGAQSRPLSRPDVAAAAATGPSTPGYARRVRRSRPQ